MKQEQSKQDIRQWFVKGCNWESGIDILLSINGYNSAIEDLKEVYESDKIIGLDKLKNQLRSYGNDRPLVTTTSYQLKTKTTKPTPPRPTKDSPPPPPPSQMAATPPHSKLMDKVEPINIKLLRAKAIGLLRERSVLHALMAKEAEYGNNKKAYILAQKIMEILTPEIDGIYKTIRKWEETKVIPSPPLSNEFIRGINLILSKEKNRTRIYKINKIIQSNMLSEDEKQKYTNELSDKKKLLNEANNQIEKVKQSNL